MKVIGERAITTTPHPPHWLYSNVDDMHIELNTEHILMFTDHMNSLNPDLKRRGPRMMVLMTMTFFCTNAVKN